MDKISVLLIGGGNIAHILLNELGHRIRKSYYHDLRKTDLEATFLESFLIPEVTDIVVECAGINAVKQHGIEAIKAGKDLYIISSGAFSDPKFPTELLNHLKSSTSKVFVPSGAIGGLDIIRAVRTRISSVRLIMTKPPSSLGYKERFSEPQVVFEGRVEKAIERFPQNVNVAVTLLLAVGESAKVTVKVVVDPTIDRNTHEVEVKSSVGDYKIVHENKPSPNLKTSYLAALSLASCINRRFDRLVVGG
ncbi:MAG: Aspartate dehydrogenase [Thermotogales bacterium 46_20]|nr:MAG: Aspartate dehydrogenase [Thermotogales bacterium 46_20]